jgi:hypothetical protein
LTTGFGNAFDHFNKTTLVDLINGSNTTAVRQSGLTATRGAISGCHAHDHRDSSALSGAAAPGDYFVKSGTLGASR